MSVVDEYQKWRCGEQRVILGLCKGIALFARCGCPKSEVQKEIELERGVWDWESSYCVHTFTVLAHYYGQNGASGKLVTERLVEDVDAEVVEYPFEESDKPDRDERQRQILEFIKNTEEDVSLEDLEEEFATYHLITDLFQLRQLGQIYTPSDGDIRLVDEIE